MLQKMRMWKNHVKYFKYIFQEIHIKIIFIKQVKTEKHSTSIQWSKYKSEKQNSIFSLIRLSKARKFNNILYVVENMDKLAGV